MPDGERRSVSARTLAAYSAALAALLGLVAFVAYRELLHYERRALGHVPAGAVFAVRADLEQLALFEPIRRHLLPLVERLPLATSQDEPEPAAAGRLGRLREAGLNLGLDLRELVFVSLDDGAWVLIAGGLFPGSDLIDRVAQVLEAEPGAHPRRTGNLLELGVGELSLARAADGVLLLGSSPHAIERALVPSAAHPALGIEPQGAASFAALAAWLEPGGDPARSGRITGRLDLGDPFPLALTLEPAAAEPDARDSLERWARIDPATAGADWGGERAVLARARFTAQPPERVAVTTTWQHAELDRACRSLAIWLEAAWTRLGQQTQ